MPFPNYLVPISGSTPWTTAKLITTVSYPTFSEINFADFTNEVEVSLVGPFWG